MSETVSHDVFGVLEKSSENGIELLGSLDLGGEGPTELSIQGSAGMPIEEILRQASAAHEKFLARRDELQRMAVNGAFDDDWLEDFYEEIGEQIDEDVTRDSARAYAIQNFSHVFQIAYWIQSQRLLVVFEDVDGIIGMNCRIEADLAFEDIEAGTI